MRAGELTIALALLIGGAQTAGAQHDNIQAMDRNNDGRVTREEWSEPEELFNDRDWNNDGVLSGDELWRTSRCGEEQRDDRFAAMDVNHDRRISRDEWRGGRGNFRKLDANRDGYLTRQEFTRGSTSQPQHDAQTRACDAGRERGTLEGRAAGIEDRERRQGFDLDGQRELEQADSGYQPTMGSRADYQAGYRDAFRLAYREGYGQR